MLGYFLVPRTGIHPPPPSNKHKESAILMVHGENLECYGLGKETISPLKYASLD